ncbi:MAG: heavy metal translocating P-type ATPase [Gammaproteobacteria bacterium]
MTKPCFHCHEDVPQGLALTVHINGEEQPVCCAGCQAVATLIISGGNAAYYRFREGPGQRLTPQDLESLSHWKAFDSQYPSDDDGLCQIHIFIEGLHCGACGWLIETRLGALEGVVHINMDVQSSAATLSWSPASILLSDALSELVRLGYRPHPLDGNSAREIHTQERNGLLRRLAVGGLGMMQVMMFAVATYAGALEGIDPAIEKLLLGVSMLVATPVVFYAGSPFLVGALRALLSRRLSMDVPVALALILAYGASCLHFFSDGGTTYFESVSMFVFFLLCARFLAMMVRHRSLDSQLALAPMLPDVALKFVDQSNEQTQPIPRTALRPGDRIRVRAGDAVAADGIVVQGSARIDESLLSGESEPVLRTTGDQVLAASLNLDGSLVVQVTASDDSSRVAGIASTLATARDKRPISTRLTERLAARFVLALLIVATLVGAVWWWIDPSRALGIVLAVLVVTCPCALSLAIPTALSAAAMKLASSGLLVNRLDAVETLVKVNQALFDKTGTLTRGTPVIETVMTNTEHPLAVDEDELLGLIASLEAHSTHPLAEAFRDITPAGPANAVQNIAGRGLRGMVGLRTLRAGQADFVGVTNSHPLALRANILISDQDGFLGGVVLGDQWRDDARATVTQLREMNIRSTIASGDRHERVMEAVTALGLHTGFGQCLPEDKLAHVRRMQERGDVVLAIGDGVNDATLLAGADVSVAVASGAQLAQSGADIVMTSSGLNALAQLPLVAQQWQRTVRQNLIWAIGYNVIAVPLAAAGLVGPGVAALGMSLSSLFVVLNSARLARSGERSVRPQPLPNTTPTPARTPDIKQLTTDKVHAVRDAA